MDRNACVIPIIKDKNTLIMQHRNQNIVKHFLNYGWLVGFVALRPKSTAMVIAGRSVHLTTLFPGQA